MSDKIIFNKDQQGIATLTLNQADIHNAFDDSLIDVLLQQLRQIEADPSIRVLLLTANGKSFSAGADLNWMQRMANYSYDQNLSDARKLNELMHTLKTLKQPTIACVQGPAYGGGVGLVACCDIAIATLNTHFCLSEVKIGLIPAVISPYVISAIGERAARYYFLTAAKMSADEAHRLGLVTQLVDAEIDLIATARKIGETILENGPHAVFAAKALLNRVGSTLNDPTQQQNNIAAIADIRISVEGQAGLQAFLNKRTPPWRT